MNIDTTKSRTDYIMKFAIYLLAWKSKLQTTIALSSTEAEYISLLQSMRDVIPIIGVLNELRTNNILPTYEKNKVRCKAFKNNLNSIKLTRMP